MKDKATGKERLYMAVTKDRLSLPLAVADSDGGGGEEESGGGDSGCLQRAGAVAGRCGKRRDIRYYPEEESKMGETAGGVIAWQL